MSLVPYQSGQAKLCSRRKNIFSGANSALSTVSTPGGFVALLDLWDFAPQERARQDHHEGISIFGGQQTFSEITFHKEYGIFLNGEGNEFGKLFFLGAMVPLGH